MSSVNYKLTAEVRSDTGKGASRRLRKAGKIPAIIYGGSGAPQSIMMDHDKLMHQLEHESFYSHILELDMGGRSEQCVLKDLQRHPAKNRILHADFLRTNPEERLRMSVPIHFINEDIAPGVKKGGMVSHNITEVEIFCLPKDLPEYLVADLSQLEIEQTLHISDIQLPEGVALVELSHGSEHNLPIAAIHKTRASIEAEKTGA
ncbi:50S ribosomal protein L25/general stress protein Ctc [Ectothiorhodospiraceae bacterium BW-2]|nr:50S ribosomal protein L25/general stress protein Ctc [Ectothiorhodospiraceae bacterium BW-2]